MCQHLLVRSVGMLRSIYAHNLYLAELMQAIQSAYILAITSCFTTETLRVSTVLDGQIFLFDDDITIDIGYRYLGSGNQIEVVQIAMIHLSFLVRKLTSAIPAGLIDHGRRHNLFISSCTGFIKEEIDERTLESGTLPPIDRKSCARNLNTQIKIYQIVFLCQLPVRKTSTFYHRIGIPVAHGILSLNTFLE